MEWIEVNYEALFPMKGERCIVLVGYPLFYEVQEAVYEGEGKWLFKNRQFKGEKPDWYIPLPKFPGL